MIHTDVVHPYKHTDIVHPYKHTDEVHSYVLYGCTSSVRVIFLGFFKLLKFVFIINMLN